MAHLNPTPVLEPGQDRTMILNMGPQHPSTHGVLRVLLEIDGETVVRIDYLCPMTNKPVLRAGSGKASGTGNSAEGAVVAGVAERINPD
jgi:Ni,Fe-hydrogenase III large subunit